MGSNKRQKCVCLCVNVSNACFWFTVRDSKLSSSTAKLQGKPEAGPFSPLNFFCAEHLPSVLLGKAVILRFFSASLVTTASHGRESTIAASEQL